MANQGQAPVISDKQFEVVLRMCEGTQNASRDIALLWVSHALGLRAKEMAALTLGTVLDVAAEDGIYLLTNKTKWALNETWRMLKHMTKNQKFREVYFVNKQARKAVETYIQERVASDEQLKPDSPLFRTRLGGPFSPNTMQMGLAAIYARAGVHGSSHSGRRTFATRLAVKGADLRAIQLLMGHVNISQTATYVDASPDRLKRVAAML